ncbi:hypothetical protein BLD44_020735 [Mastigocladus laminosus UU774]|nr:hypothetical protein BLD44_020735 [Mastigocladus laminosus UU774]
MNGSRTSIVFFDIGDTLGTPKISPPPSRLEGLDIYPYIPNVLQRLKDNGVKIGIISNTGNETEHDMRRVLEEAKIYSFFEPNLLIYSSVVGVRKPSPEIFRLAAERAGYAWDLDSTAASSHPRGDYHPQRDPAPGADDDASGVAAVLAIAVWQSKKSHLGNLC